MVFKRNTYAHLKFNKVNRRKNIKFWAESPLLLRLFPKIPINTTTTQASVSLD